MKTAFVNSTHICIGESVSRVTRGQKAWHAYVLHLFPVGTWQYFLLSSQTVNVHAARQLGHIAPVGKITDVDESVRITDAFALPKGS
jgi:hypothetical protein